MEEKLNMYESIISLFPGIERMDSYEGDKIAFVNWNARIRVFISQDGEKEIFSISKAGVYDSGIADSNTKNYETISELKKAYAASWIYGMNSFLSGRLDLSKKIEELSDNLDPAKVKEYNEGVEFCKEFLPDAIAVARSAAEAYQEIPQYKKEFPDFDVELDMPPHLKDTSWHNDAMPSFVNEAAGVLVWADYENEHLSEVSSWGVEHYRYSINKIINTELFEYDLVKQTNDPSVMRECYAKLWLRKAFEVIPDFSINKKLGEYGGDIPGNFVDQYEEMMDFCKEVLDVEEFIEGLSNSSGVNFNK